MIYQRLPFEDVFADESGGNIKTPQSEYLEAGRFPVVDQGKALIGGYIDDEARICGGGRPAIVFGDHTRCLKYLDVPFCMGADGVKVLRPKLEADLKYLYHYLRQVHLPDGGYDRHFKYLKRCEILIPPLPEQRRIAAILDQADALRAKRREALAQLDRLAQSVFVEMFGDPVSNPQAWPRKPLVELIAKDDSINYGVVQPGDDVDDGVPLVRVGDLIDGQVRHENLKRIAPEIERTYQRSRLKGDEILVSCVGSVGVVALASERERGFNIARAVARIRVGDEVVREFLATQLQTTAVQRYFTQELRTVSQPTLNIKQIAETLLICPPLSMQRLFADRLSAVRETRKRLVASSELTESMFHSLQYRAFRGDL